MEAAFIPEVNDELDTQNFEKFEEVRVMVSLHLVSLKSDTLHRRFFSLTCTIEYSCLHSIIWFLYVKNLEK